jgi:DNA-binding MarR family transcriptional regulator
MNTASVLDEESVLPYAFIWRFLHLTQTRYGSAPVGEVLVVLTIMLLDDQGYHPTVTDLADVTGLPKSSVSRYVSAEMSAGFLEEYIDPEDRRRRRLRPTAKGQKERRWQRAEVLAMYQLADKTGRQIRALSGEELLAFLKAVNARALS